MQQLERALVELSVRGDAIGADSMVERLTAEVESDSGPVVIALEPRRGIVQTIERPETTESGQKKLKMPILAAACVAVVVAGLAVVMAVRGGDTDPEQPVATSPPPTTALAVAPAPTNEQVTNDFVAALRSGDAELVRSFVAEDPTDFVGFLVALDTTGIEFSNCEYPSGSVSCDSLMGPDYFYEQIHGAEGVTPFTAAIEDGLLVNPVWPAHAADLVAEAEFEAWATETHPELVDVMFDSTLVGVVFGEDSGRARADLLDEFLIDRTEKVVVSFAAAMASQDSSAARAMIADYGTDGSDFVGWFVEMDTSGVEFFDCEYSASTASCSTTMGPDFFYERIHEQNIVNTFSVTVENGLIARTSWPAGPDDFAAERDFKAWAEQAHPELVDVMFDPTAVGGWVWNEDSGATRSALVDEFLADR